MILPAPLRLRAFAGEVTVAVRRWKRPTVRAGGTLRTPSGVLAIDSVERVRQSDLTPAIARAAGYPSRAALIASLAPTRNPLYLVRFHPGGPDPRVALRERAEITDQERAELDAPPGRLRPALAARALDAPDTAHDRRPPGGARARPGAAAGVPDQALQDRRRKLKELGLTESLEVGYRLSPRGRAYLGG